MQSTLTGNNLQLMNFDIKTIIANLLSSNKKGVLICKVNLKHKPINVGQIALKRQVGYIKSGAVA